MCLDRHHKSPLEVDIDAPSRTCSAIVRWAFADERTKGAWNNEIDATEQGAYCVALVVVELTEGLVAVRRAEKETGADYYIAPINAQVEDLEGWRRLEVSGVDKGNISAVQQRLRQKVAQAKRGKSNLPAIAAVVGFLCKRVSVQLVD